MGYFVKINNDTKRTYEAVAPNAFKNFLMFANGLKFNKVTFLETDRVKETYYDTPAHLLNKSGIILSKFVEGSNAFFKVENTTFLSKMLNKLTKEVFVHKVGHYDSISDHAFYIKDGITALYTNSFSIDLENVLKTCTAKMEITFNSQIYQLISGTGMRVLIALENKSVRNIETKRSFNVQGMTIKLASENVALYKPEFDKLNELIQKNCKEFLEIHDNQFEWASKVTRAIEIKPKEQQKKKPVKKS